jgi:hypothetical protein
VKGELERMCKAAVVTCFGLMCDSLSGVTEEYYEKPVKITGLRTDI